MEKINLFIDADDTILNSSETVIDILNEKYKIYPKKTIEDLKDWYYLSICEKTSSDEIMNIYDSDLFFEKVKIKEDFKKICEDYKEYFTFNIVTKGTWTNLEKKKEYFKKNLSESIFYGVPFYSKSEKSDSNKSDLKNFDKSLVNMDNGIHIDDRIDCLDSSNASCKILLKNGRNFYWNDHTKYTTENLYIVNSWKEIEEYLKFTINHPEWINF